MCSKCSLATEEPSRIIVGDCVVDLGIGDLTYVNLNVMHAVAIVLRTVDDRVPPGLITGRLDINDGVKLLLKIFFRHPGCLKVEVISDEEHMWLVEMRESVVRTHRHIVGQCHIPAVIGLVNSEVERPYAVATHPLHFAGLGIREDGIGQHTVHYLYQAVGIGWDLGDRLSMHEETVNYRIVVRHMSGPVVYLTLTDLIRFVIVIMRIAGQTEHIDRVKTQLGQEAVVIDTLLISLRQIGDRDDGVDAGLGTCDSPIIRTAVDAGSIISGVTEYFSDCQFEGAYRVATMGTNRCRRERVRVVFEPGTAYHRQALIVVKLRIDTGIDTSFPMDCVLAGHQMWDGVVVRR